MQIYAFDKIDGSNIRAEWTKKNGFSKFGTKTRLLDAEEKPFGESVGIIKSKYEDDLGKIFVENKWQKAIVFFEFWGNNSAFGVHAEEPHTVTLIDVNPYKKGILAPREYLSLFGHLDMAQLLYQGNANQDLIDSVKKSTLKNMTFEGIVCKGSKNKQVVMFKVKSDAWIQKLRGYCNGDEQLFEKLI